MAAPEPRLTAARALADLPRPALRATLAAERKAWTERLRWEAGDSLDLVEHAVRCGVLPGHAVTSRGVVVGHLAHQVHARQVRLCAARIDEQAGPETAELLVEALLAVPGALTRRLEGQLAVFERQGDLDRAFERRGVQVVPRDFLALTLPETVRAESSRGPAARLEPLRREDVQDCAEALVAAHDGGVEAEINAAFRDATSATAYLTDVTLGTGCGVLEALATRLARIDGVVAGFCLVTLVAPGVGHVPQVAVAPRFQGRGLGGRLLGHAIATLVASGARCLTLSVTVANRRAAAWYAGMGFRPLSRFSAYHREPGPPRGQASPRG